VLDEGATEVGVVLPGGGLWYDNLDGAAIDAAHPEHRNFRCAWGRRPPSGGAATREGRKVSRGGGAAVNCRPLVGPSHQASPPRGW
jgi:hypothetical protein